MWDKGGLVRDEQGMKEALSTLEGLTERYRYAYVPPTREFNLTWQEWLNVRSILTVARLTCLSALTRTESRGSHYRSDYPESNDEKWTRNIFVKGEGEGEGTTKVWTEKVHFGRLHPGDLVK